MKPLKYVQVVALFLSFLILSIPLINAEELNLVYDANGNLVTGDSFYREYNELNQLIRIRQGNTSTGQILEEYTWHSTEERTLIKDVFSNGVKNYTIYYVSKEFIRIENSSGNYTEKYVYQDNILVAQVDTDGNKQFVHNDHLGSVSLITDTSGNVIENTFYSPFGEIIEGGKSSRFDYEAKEFDSLTGAYDFHFRKIKPDIPIWQQPDTLIQNVYDSQLLNRYNFERSNPYRNVDEEGHAINWYAIIYYGVELVTEVGLFIGAVLFSKQVREEANKQNEQNNINQDLQEYATPEDILSISDKINEISKQPAKEVNLKEIKPENLKIDVISEQDEKDKKGEEEPFYCPNCIKKYVIEDEQVFLVTVNAQGKEVSRTSSGGGGRGGHNFIFIYNEKGEPVGTITIVPGIPQSKQIPTSPLPSSISKPESSSKNV